MTDLELFRVAFLRVTLLDVLDILAISFVMYRLYLFIRGSRAAQMAVGLLLILTVSLLAQILNMSGLSWIFSRLETIWLIAFVILFQPELRRMLVHLGQSPVIRFFVKVTGSRLVDEIVKATQELSRLRHGSLIVIVRNHAIRSVVETGIKLQAAAFAPVLLAFFSPKSPLHDGAIIIENEEIIAAKAILPLSQTDLLDKRYGTRHRAALGLSEESDALVLVTSEETGQISIAKDGRLLTDLSEEEVENILSTSLHVTPKK
ncbi:diadenylate cyclase CdaA [bacterium]|nr:MAG: TIGR00159 family protein [candidate division KSB1 bacterium]MCE7944073.1 TIGR00159 family protein [Chlorobi bacterium CHB1]MCL4706366.1 diadenylate cyclase CdaA [bacterium]MDL1878197.1 TIGR00159 family protein [Cytophagia bacterium CHB2]MBC6951298.1 TIGR00159 family protein [candidate division KSB1 bacterium]